MHLGSLLLLLTVAASCCHLVMGTAEGNRTVQGCTIMPGGVLASCSNAAVPYAWWKRAVRLLAPGSLWLMTPHSHGPLAGRGEDAEGVGEGGASRGGAGTPPGPLASRGEALTSAQVRRAREEA